MVYLIILSSFFFFFFFFFFFSFLRVLILHSYLPLSVLFRFVLLSRSWPATHTLCFSFLRFAFFHLQFHQHFLIFSALFYSLQIYVVSSTVTTLVFHPTRSANGTTEQSIYKQAQGPNVATTLKPRQVVRCVCARCV